MNVDLSSNKDCKNKKRQKFRSWKCVCLDKLETRRTYFWSIVIPSLNKPQIFCLTFSKQPHF